MIINLGEQLQTQEVMHVGLDDTDSTKGGCTTYITCLLVKELEKLKVQFIDYPGLIRLNPNVPWKTRGNGALNLRFRFNPEFEDQIKNTVISLVEEHAELANKGTDPGIVFFKKAEIPNEIRDFAKRAEKQIVTLKEALKLIKKFGAEALGYNTCRGIIGALASIGEILTEDHTYELIAYREPQNFGSKRLLDKKSVFEMDQQTQPYTYNNFDYEKQRIIITPHGPDPILFGIRGESAEIVAKAHSLVKPLEPVDRWMIFRSNQGTDMHLTKAEILSQLTPYSSAIAKGIISEKPKMVPVRHVIFQLKDDSTQVDCAAFEPTGDLRRIALELMVGDEIEVYGAVRKPVGSKPLTINLEKINVLTLMSKTVLENPVCPECKKHLKSMGKNQGFRCEKCGKKYPQIQKKALSIERELKKGLYITSTRSQRHLTKPFRRYGQEKRQAMVKSMFEPWHSP